MDPTVSMVERMMRPSRPRLSSELSEFLLALDFTPAEKKRYVRLAEKRQRESLSINEEEELRAFVQMNEMLMLLHAKARLALKRRPAA